MRRSAYGAKQTPSMGGTTRMDPKRTFFSPNVGPQSNSLQSLRGPYNSPARKYRRACSRRRQVFCGLGFSGDVHMTTFPRRDFGRAAGTLAVGAATMSAATAQARDATPDERARDTEQKMTD